jgi:hypothetical protein
MEGHDAAGGMALVLGEVTEVIGVDGEPRGHVKPPDQCQPDGGNGERFVH